MPLQSSGAKVFFCGRRENLGKQVEEKIKGKGGASTVRGRKEKESTETKRLEKVQWADLSEQKLAIADAVGEVAHDIGQAAVASCH